MTHFIQSSCLTNVALLKYNQVIPSSFSKIFVLQVVIVECSRIRLVGTSCFVLVQDVLASVRRDIGLVVLLVELC
jgi:hypothetical protein